MNGNMSVVKQVGALIEAWKPDIMHEASDYINFMSSKTSRTSNQGKFNRGGKRERVQREVEGMSK